MPSARRLKLATVASVLLGALIAAAWVRATDGPAALGTLAEAKPLAVAGLLALTFVFVTARFVRWQFLLRRAATAVPARDSLVVYLASLPGAATPAYVGEAIRCVFLRRRTKAPLRRTLLCLALERLFDFGVLCAFGLLFVPQWWMRGALVALLALAALATLAARNVAARLDTPRHVLDELFSARSMLVALALSLVVWAPVTVGLGLSAWGLGVELAPSAAVASYAGGTVFGALTLMPAGVGAAGSAQIVLLEQHGVALADAIASVTLFRALTTGVCLLVGVVFLVVELRAQRRLGAQPAREHFDELAHDYGAQFKPHVWELLLQRRTGRLADVLPPANGALGLDLGCGLGAQAQELRKRGWRVVGVDPALDLLRAGGAGGGSTGGSSDRSSGSSSAGALAGHSAVASGVALPFADASFDFVYTIGVLHHMTGPGEQDRACAEIARVLKPGGTLVVQETNTLNPLFRFYMGYVFPILSRIDEGTERWLPPARWRATPSLQLLGIQHFTFLPDFLPRALLPAFVALERKLEAGPLARYSVHYQAHLRKN
jgi:SAM-dependent methyltransferase